MPGIADLINESGVVEVFDPASGWDEGSEAERYEEMMEPRSNGGFSTVEVFEADQLIWENGKGDE